MTKAAATFFLRNFAAALIDGDWVGDAMRSRARTAWPNAAPRQRGWLRNILKAFPDKPEYDALVSWLTEQPRYYLSLVHSDFQSGRGKSITVHLPLAEAGMRTVPVTGELPAIATFGQLALHLNLTPGQLTVYADVQRLNRLRKWSDKRCPYRYCLVNKRGLTHQTSVRLGRFLRLVEGESVPPAPAAPTPRSLWRRMLSARTLPPSPVPAVPSPTRPCRLLEIPKPRLKRSQRWILDEILALLPVHDASHGFVPGRSIVTNAALHTGQEVVVRFDLKDFFPSVPASRVRGVFAKLGYPQSVSRLLMGLCTTVCIEDIEFTDPKLYELCERPHLPQGAPTSPALANLCAYRMDCRLAGLAKRFGATYTRYADDLTFSGGHELRRTQLRLRKWVIRVVTEEGFTLNAAKTRVKSQSDRQTVTGLVVNVKPNVRRRDFDLLKAILTNCVRHGPASQNREKLPYFRAHLQGRVAFVASIHAAHGAKLRAIFDRIVWPDSA